jgi:Flp pilus assembly pilin Flp
MPSKTDLLHRLWDEEEAQDVIEYSLLIAFLAVLCIGAINGASGSIRAIMTALTSDLTTASTAAAS